MYISSSSSSSVVMCMMGRRQCFLLVMCTDSDITLENIRKIFRDNAGF